MKIRSAVPENGCLIFFDGRKKTKKNKKKQKKTKKYICKTYTHSPPTGRRLRKLAQNLPISIPKRLLETVLE